MLPPTPFQQVHRSMDAFNSPSNSSTSTAAAGYLQKLKVSFSAAELRKQQVCWQEPTAFACRRALGRTGLCRKIRAQRLLHHCRRSPIHPCPRRHAAAGVTWPRQRTLRWLLALHCPPARDWMKTCQYGLSEHSARLVSCLRVTAQPKRGWHSQQKMPPLHEDTAAKPPGKSRLPVQRRESTSSSRRCLSLHIFG